MWYLHHSQVDDEQTVPIIPDILHICHCACTKRAHFHFRSKIWHQHRVPRPWFPQRRENFGNSCTFEADIGLLIFACIVRTSWPKMGVLGAKWGKGWFNVDPNELVFTFGGSYVCATWWKSIKKCDCESVQTDTVTLTHWQTQIGFIICSMLSAIAMGQINILFSTNTHTASSANVKSWIVSQSQGYQ